MEIGTEQTERINKTFQKEIGVLEVTEQTKINGKAGPEQVLAATWIHGLIQANAHEIIHQRTEGDEYQKPWIPPPVEHVARDQPDHIPALQAFSTHPPIEEKDERQKYRKVYGIEQHLAADNG